MGAAIKCIFPHYCDSLCHSSKPESHSFSSCVGDTCTDPVPPFPTWPLNRRSHMVRMRLSSGTKGEKEVGLLTFSHVYKMPRHPTVVRRHDSSGAHRPWSKSCSLQKSHLRHLAQGGPCFLERSLEPFQYALAYWGLQIFLAIRQWLGARQDHIPIADSRGPTPNSPLAAGSSSFTFICHQLSSFVISSLQESLFKNPPPPSLSYTTELAGQDPGSCLVRTLTGSSSVPRRAVVALVINKRFPSGSIFQSGLHII